VVIHQGALKAQGLLADVIQQARAENINDAFIKLTHRKV